MQNTDPSVLDAASRFRALRGIRPIRLLRVNLGMRLAIEALIRSFFPVINVLGVCMCAASPRRVTARLRPLQLERCRAVPHPPAQQTLRAHPCHICAGTGLTPAHICAGFRPDPAAGFSSWCLRSWASN